MTRERKGVALKGLPLRADLRGVRSLPNARALREEDGLTIVEVMVALSLLALAMVGLTASSDSGLRLVGSSKARQTATEVANATVERARSTPYEVLAMRTGETYETASTSPDVAVTAGETKYDAGDGAEDLVVLDESDEPLHHTQETVGGLDFEVYRYVTWVAVDEEPEAYKRVTVVVQWAGRAAGGGPNRVTVSTFINADGVGWTSTGSTTTSPPTSAPPSSTTSSTAGSACATSDGTGPAGSITILAGTGANQGYTAVPTVTLSLTASDLCGPVSMEFSNDGSSYSGLEAFSTSKAWTLPSGDGLKQVWVRYADGHDNLSVASAEIRLDTARPSTPGGFTLTAPNANSVRLTWTASADSSPGVLVGYRVYRQIGSGPFANRPPSLGAPCSTSPCRWDDSVDKKVTYSYYVVAYDAAGNESPPTVTRTRAR